MLKSIVFLALMSFTAPAVDAQPMVPDTCNDAYCRTLRRLEQGDTLQDFRAFRYSFLESPVFRQSTKRATELRDLLNLGERYWHAGAPARVVETLNKALQIDYTCMPAHRRIAHAYAELGDTASALRSKAIESGLLRSIMSSGNGKSCAKAWQVIQIEEEYYILELLGAKLQSQDLIAKRGLCDRMTTLQDGRKQVWYFEVSRVFEAYDK